MSKFWANDHLLFINKRTVLPYGLRRTVGPTAVDLLVLNLAPRTKGDIGDMVV